MDTIQPLGTNRWLVARARARNPLELNAHVFTTDGQRNGSFPVGDAIEDVQTTEDGRIWASYFDEGVFGDGELARSGLVCFDGQGRPILRHAELAERHGLAPIHDCYAVNVATARDTWLYYYTDFPLVRLRDLRSDRVWRDPPVQGARAFGVFGDLVLFAGGFDARNGLTLTSIGQKDAERIQAVDQEGKPIDGRDAFSRGSVLFLRTARVLYTLDLAAL